MAPSFSSRLEPVSIEELCLFVSCCMCNLTTWWTDLALKAANGMDDISGKGDRRTLVKAKKDRMKSFSSRPAGALRCLAPADCCC